MKLRLRLYGEVSWVYGEEVLPIRGGTRVGVLLKLAEHHGSTVSVDSLLDDLWRDRPTSGSNAVQRHISALRRQLASVVADPASIIESVPGGYRLSRSATTDAAEIEGWELDAVSVTWWEAPLPDTSGDHHRLMRSRLERLAITAFEKWQATAAPTPTDVEDRGRFMLSHTPHYRALLPVVSAARAAAHNDSFHGVTLRGREVLRDCIGLWSVGQGSAALDMLDRSEVLPPDLSRRVCRWLIWLEPDDDWARYVFSLVVKDSVLDPNEMERNIATIDGRCFEMMHDGRDIAKSETDVAASPMLRLRALRTEFVLGLSSPIDAHHEDVLARINEIELPDAWAEGLRFKFFISIRRCEYADAAVYLKEYESAADQVWPAGGDDYAQMARAALVRAVDERVAGPFGAVVPRLGGFADLKLLSVATAVRRLLLNYPTEPLTDAEFFDAVTGMAPAAGAGMKLLWGLNGNQPVAKEAERLVAELPTTIRDKQFHMLPIALGLVAEALNDQAIGTAAVEALRPWAGQSLGIWPIDFVFGPANDWIDRFAAV